MATIGSVTKRDDGRYEGEFKTHSVRADIVILPVADKAAPGQSDLYGIWAVPPSRRSRAVGLYGAKRHRAAAGVSALRVTIPTAQSAGRLWRLRWPLRPRHSFNNGETAGSPIRPGWGTSASQRSCLDLDPIACLSTDGMLLAPHV